jgi:hypothetical protein
MKDSSSPATEGTLGPWCHRLRNYKWRQEPRHSTPRSFLPSKFPPPLSIRPPVCTTLLQSFLITTWPTPCLLRLFWPPVSTLQAHSSFFPPHGEPLWPESTMSRRSGKLPVVALSSVHLGPRLALVREPWTKSTAFPIGK